MNWMRHCQIPCPTFKRWDTSIFEIVQIMKHLKTRQKSEETNTKIQPFWLKPFRIEPRVACAHCGRSFSFFLLFVASFFKTLCHATPRMATDGCVRRVGPLIRGPRPPSEKWPAARPVSVGRWRSGQQSQPSPPKSASTPGVRAQPHSRGCSRRCHRRGEEVGSGNRSAWGRQRPCPRSPRSIADCPEREQLAFSFGAGGVV